MSNIENTMRRLLKDRYNQNEFIIPSFNKNINGSLDKYFVGLEIIEQNKNDAQEASWGFDFFSKRDTIPGRRNKTGIVIQIEDMLNYSLKKIAVYGSPGTGKTTLCKKIVYDFYENSKFNNIFDDIIWIQLRRLKEQTLNGEDYKTIDELVAEYFRINENMLNFERCLFILDGWDEIHDLNEGNVVKNLLKTIVADYKIIVTSRPYADLTHVRQHSDQVLEISGFDDFNVRKYIKNVLNSGSKLNKNDEAKILEFLSESAISDMMSIPILLDIFLFTWEEIVVTQVSKLTITKLYELIVLKLWNEFIENERPDYRQQIGYNNQKLKSVIAGPMLDKSFSLSKIACKSFERGDLLFVHSEIEGDNDCRNALLKSRFLNGIDVSEGNDTWKRYEFIHLTFCEFFTALNYVHHKSLDEFRQIVAKYKYNITYRIVFGFMSGLLSSGTHSFAKNEKENFSNDEMLNIFFDCLESEPIDLIRSYHNILTATCLNECSHVLNERRVTEICKDLCDTHIQKLPKITSLAMVKAMVKNKFNLIKFIGLRLPNLSDQFFLESDFTAIDPWSKVNILCSQVSFNEASKTKLKELLIDGNKSEVYNFFSNNCMRAPDFFLIYIIEHFTSVVQKYNIITRLYHIKMSLKDAISVCANLEPIISESDSIPDIIRKIICHSNLDIVYFAFLRNSYECVQHFMTILPTMLDECNNSSTFISRILFVIAFSNISSLVVLNKFMTIMDTFKELRPLVVRIIFHLYFNKWLPYSVALRLINYLQKDDESMEDHFKNSFIDICTKYPTLFRNDNMKFNMYELVCEGLAHSNFQPKLLDSIIDRLCTGEEVLDEDMSLSYLLSKRSLTQSQVNKFIETDKISFEDKFWFLRCQTHHKDVTAFLTRNAGDMFAVDNSSELYMKIDKDFNEKERQELLEFSTEYTRYHIEHTTSTLEHITNKINEMINNELQVFEACKKYCKDLCFESFKVSINEITIEKLSELFECAFKLSYLSLNQRAMHITHGILQKSRNPLALDIEQMIDNFWNYETPINVFNEKFFQHLSDDILGSYYFKILNKTMQNISRASMIKWISPLNIKHLLTFLIHEITTFKHALYIQPSSPNLYRLHSSTCQSSELGTEDVKFIYEFKPITKYLDHSCRQVRKNSVNDYFTMDQCKSFIMEVTGAEKLDEISDKQYHTDSQFDQFFKGPQAKEIIEQFKMLYNQKILSTTHFDMWWATFYAYHHHRHFVSDINFGPYHINLSDSNITDEMVVNNLEKFLLDNKKNVHVLVLSNNNITINGFEYLMKSVKESELRHLFLDGNLIYFDKKRFDDFEIVIRDTSFQLLTLDLSCNFIATEWIDKLKFLNGESFTNSNVKYCLINNCRVIYERNLLKSHLGYSPAIDFIAKMEAKVVPLKITQEKGCVGHVCKKQHFGYSGHVLLFIERIFNGQREVKTAELFQDKNANNICKVVIRHVDPFVDHDSDETCRESLRNRLLLYDVPKRVPFPNETIVKILDDIKNSQDKDNFFEYNIATENEFENRFNCIKWANDIMEPYVGFKILEIKIPWFYKSSSKKLLLETIPLIIFIFSLYLFNTLRDDN